MGDGSYVPNQGDFESSGLEGAESAFSSCAGAFDEHGDGAHAVVHSAASGFFGCQLRGEGSALA